MEIDNTTDVISVSDITERVDALQSIADDYEDDPAANDPLDEDEAQELKVLTDLLEEMRSNGGDHQWNGDWYPGSMIRDSYFKDYAMELADDIGAVDANASWPNTYIDWDAAAEALQQDYSSIEYQGIDYWYR